MDVIDKLPSLQLLLKQLQRVPYLASKNLYRVSMHFLEMNHEQLQQFCDILLKARDNLMCCPLCNAWQEKDGACQFCSSKKRDKKIVCVVATWQDLLSIEKSGAYQGVYHVLGGLICPLDGVQPSDLQIDLLLKRVDMAEEFIFAFSQTPEGETTAAYIADKLKGQLIKITCLAQGMPVGSSLEYIDRLTVYKALSQRKEF